MSSFISSFKAWALALVVIGAVEAAYYAYAAPRHMDRTNLLQYGFAQSELPQRLFTWHKMRDLARHDWEIVQVGDSSGFHGIDPRLVEKYLPAGYDYVNMSCCANQGFRGYYNVLKYMLENVPTLKYAVLYFTPYTMPRVETWLDDDGAALWGDPNIKVFGGAIGDEVNPPWVWLRLPTLAARRDVTHEVFFLGGLLRSRDEALSDNENYLAFLHSFQETKGWMPANDHPVYISPEECRMEVPKYFDIWSLRETSILEEVLDAYAELAGRHGVKLAVVFQPSGCTLGSGDGSRAAREALARFAAAHPDVAVPFPLIESWDPEAFLVPAHVRNEWVPKTTERLGRALKDIIRRDHRS